MEIALRSEEDEICRAAEAVESLCPAAGFSRDRCDEVRTAVLEALSNAMTHAHRSRPDLLILVRAAVAEGSLFVEIRDQGPGPAALPPPPDLEKKLAGTEHPRGWGIHLMRMLASQVEFRVAGGSNTLRLRFEAARPDEPVPARIRNEPEG
jgi:anti-sigma regulatory factor (Ser/Thr protein kinase)